MNRAIDLIATAAQWLVMILALMSFAVFIAVVFATINGPFQ